MDDQRPCAARSERAKRDALAQRRQRLVRMIAYMVVLILGSTVGVLSSYSLRKLGF